MVEEAEPKSVVLTIEQDTRTGEVRVTGPLQNKMLCYALLGTARDEIQEFHRRQGQQQGGIIRPTLRVPGLKLS